MYIYVYIQHRDGIRIYIIYTHINYIHYTSAVASLHILQISHPKMKDSRVLGPLYHDTHC